MKDVIAAVLKGYNGTIMAFGQTGSGKTHTLLGSISSAQDRGIVPRAVEELGRGIAAYPEPCKFRVRALAGGPLPPACTTGMAWHAACSLRGRIGGAPVLRPHRSRCR